MPILKELLAGLRAAAAERAGLREISGLTKENSSPLLLTGTSSRGRSCGGEQCRLFTSSNGRYFQRGGMCWRIRQSSNAMVKPNNPIEPRHQIVGS